MIGRRSQRENEEHSVGPKGFDAYDLRLGDVMRGERATMGKSLLDVQRELRIKASYIAAIENCDPSAFDTPGFIAGYVRSYARYLGMDPDQAFAGFCAESGFAVAHGMSDRASVLKKTQERERRAIGARDPFDSPALPFAPVGDSLLSRIEPRAVGSSLVLVALICGIGYGGWAVLREVQQVQMAPVDQTPVVLADLDPIAGAGGAAAAPGTEDDDMPPAPEALDRLYRPQALDVPVLVARDAPISTLDPRQVGSFASPDLPEIDMAALGPRDATDPRAGGGIDAALAEALGAPPLDLPAVPQVVEDPAPELRMVAVRPAWVRVRAANGSVIFEGIMEAGQSWDVPAMQDPPVLRVGESGAVYFETGGKHYGPIGPSGTVTSNVALSIEDVTQTYAQADPDRDGDLARMVAEAGTAATPVPTE